MESPPLPGRVRPGGKSRMPAVNGVGEPCAGEPHARFDAAGAGNGADLARGLGWRNRTGNRRNMKAPGPTVSEPPRQPPTLQRNLLACGVAVPGSGAEAG